jgi:hypothetical protein
MPIDYAPAPFQKIFKLEKFLPNYSVDVSDRNIVAWPDGTLGLRKGSRKISSPSTWMVATNGLGQYLAHPSASQKETEFTWNEFHIFMDRVHAYFSAYSFDPSSFSNRLSAGGAASTNYPGRRTIRS